MVRESEIREGELAVELPTPRDAGLVFIGRIRTPWTSRLQAPRQGRHDGPVCRLEIFEPFVPAIKGVDFYSNLEVLYWLHLSRRDLVLQSPKNNKSTRGTFSLRSPVRPNPIGTWRHRRPAISRRSKWSFRHCEERSDEAIHSFLLRDGLLRFARNDDRFRSPDGA
jgi:hypothetical protein